MSNRKSLIAFALTVSAALGATQAHAAGEPGFYAGVTVGQSKFDSDLSRSQFDALGAFMVGPLTSSNLDDKDTAFSLFVGYRINPYFAVEAAYVDLGELSYRASSGPDTFGYKVQASGGSVSGLLIWPVTESFDVYGRGGYFFSRVKTKLSLTGFPNENYSDNSNNGFFGIGASYAFTKNWAVLAEWQKYTKLTDSVTDVDADAKTISVGVKYRW